MYFYILLSCKPMLQLSDLFDSIFNSIKQLHDKIEVSTNCFVTYYLYNKEKLGITEYIYYHFRLWSPSNLIDSAYNLFFSGYYKSCYLYLGPHLIVLSSLIPNTEITITNLLTNLQLIPCITKKLLRWQNPHTTFLFSGHPSSNYHYWMSH